MYMCMCVIHLMRIVSSTKVSHYRKCHIIDHQHGKSDIVTSVKYFDISTR
ncbi:hypothetical protein X777_15442 [Ooceraea biroi]|uniref:Uncharacterized protein n=1 Tax=Ooceraea biroi TaxID=2015173 RepID=A0A026VXW3_OOCBI|nr:hypothetical protein X777_15442 [Ooceraea biroi]